MRRQADAEGITSIAMPRIGVGYGGLSWKKVRAIVEAVPEALLRRPPGELDSAVYEWRRTITEDQFPELARQPTM